MVLMAIDHVRVYAGLPAGGPTVGIFFTRWVTHFCAPAFLFLAGSSAFLRRTRHGDLSRFLVVRGLWLVLLELTVLRLAWTFNLDFAGYEMAGVIWVIGWSMVLMAGLVRLPVPIIGAIGVAIIAGHNLLDATVIPTLGNGVAAGLWKILYVGFWAGPIRFGPEGPSLVVLYSIIPWIGVMATGYAFGAVLTLDPARRNRIALALGIGATLVFVILRGIDRYGDPRPWSTHGGMPPFLAFLNTTKYPASLSFLLMTLGPTIAVIPLVERARGWYAGALSLVGRVPFFYYLLHIPLIHALALVVSAIQVGTVSPWLFANHPMGNPPAPEGYAWSLGTLYLVWIVALAILYPACRWFAGVKARRRTWWLAYL